MAKPAHKKKPAAAQQMTTADAVVGTLVGHGIDTIYALPGVQNDHLFDALFRAAEKAPHRTSPPRARHGADGAGRGARDRPPAGLRGCAGARFAQCGDGAY